MANIMYDADKIGWIRRTFSRATSVIESASALILSGELTDGEKDTIQSVFSRELELLNVAIPTADLVDYLVWLENNEDNLRRN